MCVTAGSLSGQGVWPAAVSEPGHSGPVLPALALSVPACRVWGDVQEEKEKLYVCIKGLASKIFTFSR